MDSIVKFYNYLNEDLASPVSKDWFLVSSIWPLLSIIIFYNIFSRRLGPYLMKDRQPFELKNVIKIYNILQVFLSSYLVYEGYWYIFDKDFSMTCQGPDPPESPKSTRIASAIHVYYMLKLVELLDTLFFVLRKSFRQVSSLHLHHHSLMPIASWIAVKYIPGGQCVLLGAVNSFVHVVMYGYYLLAGLGPEYKKYLWWKKYVTVLQLVQFVGLGIHSFISLFFPCNYPVVVKILTILYSMLFTNMFGQFYYQAYIKKKPEENGKTNGTTNGVHTNKKKVDAKKRL